MQDNVARRWVHTVNLRVSSSYLVQCLGFVVTFRGAVSETTFAGIDPLTGNGVRPEEFSGQVLHTLHRAGKAARTLPHHGTGKEMACRGFSAVVIVKIPLHESNVCFCCSEAASRAMIV